MNKILKNKALKALAISVFTFSTAVFCKAETTLLEKDSMYNSIRVVRDGRFLSLYCGNGHQSTMDTVYPDRLVFNYTKVMMTSLAFDDQIPRDMLLIGGGGASIPKAIQKNFPNVKLDVVEIDPEVDKVAQQFFLFKPSKNTNVHVVDGRIFVKKAKKKYDLIMLDAYRGGYIPFHLLTREFLQELKGILKPDGFVVSNTFTGSKIRSMENNTYSVVYKNVYEMVTGGNRIVVADNRSTPLKKDEIINRARIIDEKNPFTGISLHNILSKQFVPLKAYNAKEILTDDHSPAELLGEE